ncbi:hypothetical protein [Methylocystis sp. S23]|jgi:hypothetical protein
MIAGHNLVATCSASDPFPKNQFEILEEVMSITPMQLESMAWAACRNQDAEASRPINCADKPRGQDHPMGYMHKTLPKIQKKRLSSLALAAGAGVKTTQRR